MPIYEYSCSKCGEFEVTQRITDEPLRKCPTCRGRVKKLISNTSFQLKGSGWYVTDYGRKGGKEKSGEGKEKSTEKTDSGTKTESSGDTKSTAKSEPSGKSEKTKAAA
jgi:putative FmdB family regulatory protein